MTPEQQTFVAKIAVPGLSHVSPSGTDPAGCQTGRRDFFTASGGRAPKAEVHMLKPIIFEVAVMFVAAISYLWHREFAGQLPAAATATSTGVVDLSHVSRPEAVQTAVPDLQTVQAWVVPGSAVLHVDGQDYVFVKKDAGHFQRMQVRGYALAGNRYAITGGLDARQPVAMAGAGELDRLADHAP